ncbi:MAG: alcohol dehydrogenase [Bdellovibrionales bacterium GWA2_49_15]|nr:MAG: alcohol dehydrogenase [Bdellovibrionales bacterium GWA2_49_15]
MENWKNILISPSTPIIETMKIIDKFATQIAVVRDEQDRALGTITDGDIRRGLLKGIPTENCASEIMNKNFSYAQEGATRSEILAKMRSKKISCIPILDAEKRIVNLIHLHDLEESGNKENQVVILAGGMGTRLGELTMDCPKPLLKIGNSPILENIIQHFKQHGFSNFQFAVNYKSEMIEEYFNDGSKWGAQINYIKENTRLGTAGPLSLLDKAKIKDSFIVMNGDLLTTANFTQLLEFHNEHKHAATMCVRQYDIKIPYGVISLEGGNIIQIEEKPTKSFFVNAGIYVFSPKVLDLVPKNQFYDMTTFFQDLVANGHTTGVFPLHEYWIDIGQLDDLNRAREDIAKTE